MSAALGQLSRPVTEPARIKPVASVPSRFPRRLRARMHRAVALCAMGSWVAVGLMPVAALVYAIYGS